MNYDQEQTTRYLPESDGPQAVCGASSELNPQADAAVISKSTTASGDLRGTGTVLVEGTVIGKIILKGAVTVASTGIVKGPIQADSVYVAGCVEGGIIARKCLRLEMTGSITGNVTVNSFVIEDGGHFNGRSQMTKSGEEPVILY